MLIFLLLLPSDSSDPNNYIELALWVTSIIGLLTMKKVGAAFTIIVLCITLSTSMGIVIYYGNEALVAGIINGLRIIINIVAVILLFRLVFANRFK